MLVQGGGGGVGMAAGQLAKRAGATVFSTASSGAKLDRLKDFGVDHGINYAEEDVVAEVRRLTEGRGIDLVVDGVGGAVTQQSFACTAYKGRVMMYGTSARDFRKYDLTEMRMNKTIVGVSLTPEFATKRVIDMIERHIVDIAARKLRVVVDKSFPLEDAAAAHAYIESRQAFGRVLLIP